MAEDNETKILGNKATIYTNKFGMWQFRLWLANENKYVRKSLKTKEKTLAIERGEELYIEIAHNCHKAVPLNIIKHENFKQFRVRAEHIPKNKFIYYF